MSTTSIFFNQAFDKKRLKAFLHWVLKTFGEKEALIVVERLKSMGFYNATKAGLSIGLHDLRTPDKKKSLISQAQLTMTKNDQEFQGAELTATERSQRIVDTWHRTSEDLRKQVVDYFSTYDQLNSVYMMALSGARGNFSQVRQLIGMRGLMADPQGQIINFPIRSNLREGLTLTEYFISCSGARKGLVDTALRTADTGYLTRRLVDISHHVVVKRVTCYTSRGIALKTLRTPQKILLSLRDRLVGRVLAEDIYSESDMRLGSELVEKNQTQTRSDKTKLSSRLIEIRKQSEQGDNKREMIARKNQEISPDLALKISSAKENCLPRETRLSKQDVGIHFKGLSSVTDSRTPHVLVRSPLTCTYTHELCQLCYGWSMAQGSLVALGEAVGVIAGQSIGEPGTQLTMRTFHTGGVFSGDLLQEIRAPHSGKISFPKALQGLLIRTSQGRIAFLIKVSGELLLENTNIDDQVKTSQTTRVHLAPSTILFVRQGERVRSHQLLAELAITTEEGNQPIKSRQTLFSEIGGRIVPWKSMTAKMHRTKGLLLKAKQNEFQKQSYTKANAKDSLLQLQSKAYTKTSLLQLLRYARTYDINKNKVIQKQKLLYVSTLLNTINREKPIFNISSDKSLFFHQAGSVSPHRKDEISIKPSVQAYLGPVEITQNLLYPDFDQSSLIDQNHVKSFSLQRFVEQKGQHYEQTWGYLNNVTLKKIALAKRHGLGAIEPVQALKLGLLGVIATRVGSSERRCTTLSLSSKKTATMPALRIVLKNNKINNLTISSITNKVDTKTNIHCFPCLKNSYTTWLQHLNTVAKEGDLVDENYNQL